MKKGEAIKQMVPIEMVLGDDEIRAISKGNEDVTTRLAAARQKRLAQSMNMHRAVHGGLGNETNRTFFALYEGLCRESITRGERFKQLSQMCGHLFVKCLLACDKKFFRDVAALLENWPPSQAKEQTRFVSPTHVSAQRFFHYALQRGRFTRLEARQFIERESGQRVSKSHLTDLIDRYGMKSILQKSNPGPKPTLKTKRSLTKSQPKKKQLVRHSKKVTH